MSKKVLKIVSVLICASLLTGCILPTGSGDKDQTLSNANIPGNPAASGQPGNPSSDPSDPANPQTDPDGNIIGEDAEITVTNNGTDFVAVDEWVYFRKMTERGLQYVASPEYVMSPSSVYSPNEICCININNPENIITVCEDYGEGPLYYYNSCLYSSKTTYHPDNGYTSEVYKIDLSDSSDEFVCLGNIVTASEDGSVLLVSNYTQDKSGDYVIEYYFIKDGLTFGYQYSVVYTDAEYSIIGLTNEDFFILRKAYDEDTAEIIQYNFVESKECVIAEIPLQEKEDEPDFYMYSYPITKDFEINGDTISFNLHFCQDSGEWVALTNKITVDMTHDYSKSTQDTLKVEFVDEDEYYSLTYKDYPVQFDKYTNLNTNDYCGYSKQLCSGEIINGVEFAVVADCHEVMAQEMCEETTYHILNLHYYVTPAGSSEPVEIYTSVQEEVRDLYARIFFTEKYGDIPTKVIYQMVIINGVETPPDFDNYSYVAYLSDDFKYEHVPENGDIYDEFETDDLEYMMNDIYSWDNAMKLFVKTPADLGYGKLDVPNDGSKKPWESFYVHITFNEKGEIDYMRPVIFD